MSVINFDGDDLRQSIVAVIEQDVGNAARLLTTEPLRAAEIMTTAVAVAMQYRVPMRLSTMCRIRLDGLIDIDDGVIGGLNIEGRDLKNGVSVTLPLPPMIVAVLEAYRAEFRQHLPGAALSPWLFPGKGAAPLSFATMEKRIRMRLLDAGLVVLGSRYLRHVDIALAKGDLPTAMAVLGHRSSKTTGAHYKPLTDTGDTSDDGDEGK